MRGPSARMAVARVLLAMGRAFNAMAGSLEDQRVPLEEQNARLEEEKARIARYSAFGRRIAGQSDAEELGVTILAELTAVTGAERAVLFAFDPDDAESVAALAAHGLPGPVPDLPAEGPYGRTLGERGAVRVSAHSAERLLDSGEELGVPLVQADSPVGLVVLARGSSGFSSEAVAAVSDVAPQIAATLSNVLALRSARARASVIRAVLDATPDAITVLDSKGRTVLENPPMRAVRRALVESVRAPGGGFRTRVSVQGADPEEEVRDELQLQGTGRVFARYATPVRNPGGASIGRLVVLREVTGEREAERVKDEFFALVSHELRTPLTSVIGYLELVLDPEERLAPEHRRYLEVVQRNATRLLRLVSDLLFVAEVEAGTLSLAPTEISLPQIVADAVEAARPLAEARGIELKAEIEPVPPARGDRDRLGQVLDNLITNACKFTPKDGQVRVRLTQRDGDAVVEVADTGVGIPEDEQDRLFERFFRASSATERAIPGLGLGLTIVKAVAEAHGGRVALESREDEGTTFRVALPLRRGTD